MTVYRFVEKILVLGLLCLCSWTSVMAQQSGSAASVSRSRAIVNAGPNAPVPTTSTYYPTYNPPRPVFKIPEEIAVEEFVNYHKHRLPLPKSGQAVAMDTRWGNARSRVHSVRPCCKSASRLPRSMSVLTCGR